MVGKGNHLIICHMEFSKCIHDDLQFNLFYFYRYTTNDTLSVKT